MKITQEEMVDRQTVLHIELEDEDLGPYLDSGYRQVAKNVVVPGFRRGKAPRVILETYLGREALLRESVEFLVPDVTATATSAQGLEPWGEPQMELLGLEPVTVKATVPLTPEVTLGPYRDIRVPQQTMEVTEEEVQQRLRELQGQEAPWQPIERPVKIGDMVTMNVLGVVEEETVYELADQVYVLSQDSDAPFPGFASHLEGMEVGVAGEFDLTVPDDHPTASVAGKEVRFEMTLSEAKEQDLPDLDDEFAKGVGDGFENLKALRENVEADLLQKKETSHQAANRMAAVEELLKGATWTLPPLSVQHELDHQLEERKKWVDVLNIRMDDYLRLTGVTEEESQEQMRERAEHRVASTAVLQTLADVEGVELSNEEIDEEIADRVEKGGEEAEAIRRQGEGSDRVRDAFRTSLLMGKALDRLVEIADRDGPPQAEEVGSETDGSEQEEGEANVDTNT